jgi:hypothetical protein
MVARDIVLARNDRMREAVAAVHAIAKTQNISSDQTSHLVTIEGSAREAGLAEWLIGELDKPNPAASGHGYVMPHDSDDVTVVVGDLRVGGPISAGGAHLATLPDLQEIVNAIRVLGDIPRTTVYAPSNVLVWRGKVWQNDFALWLLQELGSFPAANWTAPISLRLDKMSSNVRVFYFAPATTTQDLGEVVSTIRSKARAQRVVAINVERVIAMRGSDIEADAAERIVAAARH